MSIPNFAEFEASLTSKDYEKFFGLPIARVFLTDNVTPEYINGLINQTVESVVLKNIEYTLNLLEAYHEWLRKQIDQ